MSVFLIDKEEVFTYNDLLQELKAKQTYCPLLKTRNLFDFFCNLIAALSCNKPLVLLDGDINAEEISGIDERAINALEALPEHSFDSMQSVVESVYDSTSSITIFTSGTTGQPKKVVHSVKTLTRSVRMGDKYKDQVWGFAYNPTHMAGLQVFFQAFTNLNTLANVFNTSRLEVYAAIDKYHISHLSATPTFYRLLLPFEKEYASVQRVTLGGEKSDTRLYESIRKIFPQAKINNVYASTEAGSLFAAKGDCFMLPQNLSEKFKVIDNELLIHKSLLGESDSFKLDGDFYHSGDIIEWVDQSQGLFRFCSRKNELINVGGYKVNPGEIENALLTISGIKQAIVFGKPNVILGNVLCAEVQLCENMTLTELQIREKLKECLQDFKIPRQIKFVDSFSLTRTGKIMRR